MHVRGLLRRPCMPCMAYAWHMHGMDMHGMVCDARARPSTKAMHAMHGICMAYAWHGYARHGMRCTCEAFYEGHACHAWHMHGICMAWICTAWYAMHVRGLLRRPCMPCMAYAWHMHGMDMHGMVCDARARPSTKAMHAMHGICMA